MNQFLLTLALGAVVGVLGNFTFQWTQAAIARFRDRIQMAGTWGERMLDGTERVYSIGQIYYDMRRRMWVLNGTNYHNDGRPFCHWRTVASYVDRADKRFYYIFLNTHVDASHTGYTGFGFVDLGRQRRSWLPRNGSFVAGHPGESFRSHSMVKLGAWPADIDQVRAAFTEIESAQ